MSDNFNYIAFAARASVENEVEILELSRGRMFEYTPIDIEKRLEDLGPGSVGFLKQLPTFLCSEIYRSGEAVAMLIKYGRITNIAADRKEVLATFDTLTDLGEVKFDTAKQAQEIFGADELQLYRTHWAVREGNAQRVLNKLAQLKPTVAVDAEELLDLDLDAIFAELPPRAKNSLGIAPSVEEFLRLLYDYSAREQPRHLANDQIETFFRGHNDATFELTPSLLRKWPGGAWQFMPKEDRLCKELLIAHYDEFQGDQYCFDRLVRMQHYGLPTRLLDISGNPLVALFFACHGGGKLESDGEVIVLRVSSDKVKYFDSDTVSCLANLSNLTYAQKNEIDLTLDVKAFNETGVANKLLHHIKSEKGFFEGRIVPDDLGSVVCVKAKRTNTRIKSQSGAFLLFGHEAALPESGQEEIEIARITISNKPHILDQLDSININATTVYPSIDQTTIHLRDLYRQPEAPK